MKYELVAIHDYGMEYTYRTISVFEDKTEAENAANVLNERHKALWNAIGDKASKEALDEIFESIKSIDTEIESKYFKTINRYAIQKA